MRDRSPERPARPVDLATVQEVVEAPRGWVSQDASNRGGSRSMNVIADDQIGRRAHPGRPCRQLDVHARDLAVAKGETGARSCRTTLARQVADDLVDVDRDTAVGRVKNVTGALSPPDHLSFVGPVGRHRVGADQPSALNLVGPVDVGRQQRAKRGEVAPVVGIVGLVSSACASSMAGVQPFGGL
jgi:hypothetical protein